ncbi:hypothetical protein CB1_056579103 [Camelus ferus]|nr:hypothetical protein CB1_056579103 [Camelus ferus]
MCSCCPWVFLGRPVFIASSHARRSASHLGLGNWSQPTRCFHPLPADNSSLPATVYFRPDDIDSTHYRSGAQQQDWPSALACVLSSWADSILRMLGPCGPHQVVIWQDLPLAVERPCSLVASIGFGKARPPSCQNRYGSYSLEEDDSPGGQQPWR